ncbi:hypothetical protein TIFTF001_021545 [Ficus carica]|uniref:Uncharacterized protein n=1 Tax=Ficus carica TaxID=3494 RepID=A0AA88AHP0_FICCA|nr:hypothetical protein TIFTF001_021545 [Ficus carica]
MLESELGEHTRLRFGLGYIYLTWTFCVHVMVVAITIASSYKNTRSPRISYWFGLDINMLDQLGPLAVEPLEPGGSVSRPARRAVRSVLPVAIPTKLVGFSVNGVLILAVLWVLKAFLEVVCTLGSVVFVSILFIQGAWTGVIYLQDGRNRNVRRFEDENNAWKCARPAA